MSVVPWIVGPYLALVRNRSLIWRLAGREIGARTKSTMLGPLWLVLSPLLLLAVYTFVLTAVLRAKWNLPGGGEGDAAFLLFTGMTVFSLLSECINRAPGLVLENVAYVKKVVFPLETLGWVSLIGAMLTLGINLALLLLAYVLVYGLPPASALMIPIVLLPAALVSLGLTWFLSSLGVFLRDIRQLTGFAVTCMMFMGPVFYPLDAVPEPVRTLMYFNPITLPVEQTRQVLFYGQMPDLLLLGGYLVISFAIASLGYYWFIKTRKGFADVL